MVVIVFAATLERNNPTLGGCRSLPDGQSVSDALELLTYVRRIGL
jgi:hypothetical protein